MAETEEILNEVLETIAKAHNFDKFDVKVEQVSNSVANYSALFSVTIKEGRNRHHLFAKVGTLGETIDEGASNVYLTEIYAYNDLSKVYESLQDRYEVPEEHRLKLSKCNGCIRTKGKESLVLENLRAKGYKSFNSFKSYNWEYAAAAVREMAKLHALSFAYSEYYPERFKEVFNTLNFCLDVETGPMGVLFKVGRKRAIDKAQEKYNDKLRKYFRKFGAAKFRGSFAPIRKPVLIHADF